MLFSPQEPAILCRYLISEELCDPARVLYERAVSLRDTEQLTPSDRRILDFAFRHPSSVQFLDAALARSRPNSRLRIRLYIMAAILETQPRYAAKFLPVPRKSSYAVCAAFFALRSVVKAVAGLMLLPFIE